MERWVEDLFTDDVLTEAAGKYGVDRAKTKNLGGFENYVFEVYKDGTPYILRLTHSSHRSKSELEGELQWINYLHDNEVNVSLVHESMSGSLVEEIKTGETSFFVCLFDKAPGRMVKVDGDLFEPALFETWGETVGKLHRVTKGFVLDSGRRDRWDQDDLLDFELYLNRTRDAEIIAKGIELVKEIKALPENPANFGLIHSDIHPGNFFYNEGEIHVFDFDDSTYHWYISDIAIPLYYSTWWKYRSESLEVRSRFGEVFLYHFLKGFQKEHQIEPEWITKIPLFLKLRDFELYTVFHKKWDMASINKEQQQLVEQIRERIIRDELMVMLPYKDIIERLKSE